MSWRLDQPPKADANSFAYKDWILGIWKFISFNSNVVSVAINYNAMMQDKFIIVNASGGARSITLPFAAGNLGKEIIIKKNDSSGNAVTAVPRGTETIDGSASTSTTSKSTPIRLVSDNTNWLLW